MIESHYTEEINTAGQLEFSLPSTMRLPQNVFFVCITDPNDETSYLMFKIITEKVTDEQVTYTCIENAYDELASYTYIQDKRPTAIASTMLQMTLDGTRWSVGACPEVSPKFCSFYYISVLEAIQKIVNLWGFEVQFQVKIDGITNEIKQRNVNMYTKLGERTNKRFEYGSNLLSVTQANDSTGLYTALVGRGKGVQVSEGDTDTDPDGYGRRITFADVVWSTQSGNPLNKPAGQEYLEDSNATAAYGFPDGHPRIGFVVFQDCEDPNELIQLTYNKLQEVNHPQVQFSASIADIGYLNLGDTIAIIRHDIGIEYYTRVFKVVHDLLDSSNNTVELGDNIAGSNSITQQISTIKDNQSNVQNAIDTIVMNGADGNKLFFGTKFPTNGTDGDIFYRTLENGGTEMYIYKDGGWELVVSTVELDAVQKKVDEQTSQIQQAVDSANSAVSKADEAVSQVGTLDENVKNLDAESKQNQNDIAQAKSDLLQTKSDLEAAKANISAAQADIQADKQSIQSLSAEAQKQGETITSVQNTQNTLSASVADVKGNVTALKETSNSLQAMVAALNSDNLIYNSDFLASVAGKSSTDDWLPADGWYSVGNTAVQRCMWYGYSSLQVGWIPANGGFYTQPIISNTVNPNDLDAATEYSLSFLIKTSPGVYDFYVDCSYDGNFDSPYSIKIGSINEVYSPWTNTNFTFSVPSKYPWIRLRVISEQDRGLFYLAHPMLVYGNQVPQSYISSNQPAQKITSIKVDLDGLKSVVQDNQGNISKLQQRADEISTTVSSNTGDISQLKQTANSLQSSITDNSNNISSLKQTANSLQSSVTDANNNISQLKQQSGYVQSLVATVNSDNLITNSDCLTNAQGVSPTTDWKPAWGWSYTDGNLVGRANWYGYSALQLNQISSNKFAVSQAVQAGNPSSQTTYSVSLKYMLQKTDVRHWVNIQADYDQSFSNPKFYNIGDATQIDGNNWQALTGTVTIPAETPWVRLCIGVEGDSGYIWIAQPMLVVGDKIPDSYISSNQPAQQMTSIKQSVDSIKSMAQDNQGNISQLQQTASSLQSVVSTKADLSQVTQMGNVIQSVVRSVGTIFPNGDFSSSDIQSFWQPWDTTHDYVNIKYDKATYNGSYGNLLLHSYNGVVTKTISSDFIPVSPSNNVNVSVDSRADWYGSNQEPQLLKCYVHFYNSQKQETSSGSFDLFKSSNQNWGHNQVNYGTSEDECFIRIEFILQGNSEGYAHLTNVKAICGGGENVSSKISQLANDINLRVQKGDLISQINIEAGQTLIQSDKLYLDASSVVFSGNAFIPSAAITDLSADKIKTGTLNAANVHVINMDVANLVGDTTSFVRSQWQNAYGAYVNIESDGMSVGYGNWYTKFDSSGMTFKDGGDDLGGFTRIGMQGAPGWYGGLAMNAGGNAEFLSIGAKDYGNVNQNPIPPKLLWMRRGIDTYGYNPGWNVLDDIWMSKVGMDSIQYGGWNIKFGIVTGDNGFSALTLTSGSGDGFYWGSDGSFGYVTGGNTLHNVRGSQIVYSISSSGNCQTWSGV